jgi:hypothetical protein
MSDNASAAPKPPKQTRYVTVELQTATDGTEGAVHVWAACVDAPSRVFMDPLRNSFRIDSKETILQMLELLVKWASEDGVYDVEFVAWKKDRIVALLSAAGDESLVADWLDFISYHAGQHGISYSEARGKLMRAHEGTIGVARASVMASLFGHLRSFALHQAGLLQSALELKAAYENATMTYPHFK